MIATKTNRLLLEVQYRYNKLILTSKKKLIDLHGVQYENASSHLAILNLYNTTLLQN